MMKKITSRNGFIFLFNDIPHESRNKMGIASGESVLLSIYENDSYYFHSDINLITYDSIISTEEPTDLEIKFFNLLKDKREIKYKKILVDEYNISMYVHYLPKIKYTQSIKDNKIIIHGQIKYPVNIYEIEIPTIILDDNVVPLIDNYSFEYQIDLNSTIEKLDFKMDLPKQVITRSYKLKR